MVGACQKWGGDRPPCPPYVSTPAFSPLTGQCYTVVWRGSKESNHIEFSLTKRKQQNLVQAAVSVVWSVFDWRVVWLWFDSFEPLHRLIKEQRERSINRGFDSFKPLRSSPTTALRKQQCVWSDHGSTQPRSDHANCCLLRLCMVPPPPPNEKILYEALPVLCWLLRLCKLRFEEVRRDLNESKPN